MCSRLDWDRPRGGGHECEFILRASLRSAEEVLAEQQHFALTPHQWAEFVAAVDRPPAVIAALTRAARSKPSG